MDTIDISWYAPEWRHYEKNFAWYFTFCAVAVLIIFFTIISREYFATMSLIIIAGFGLWFAGHKPKDVLYGLSDTGIHIDDLILPYGSCKWFWIVNDSTHKHLNIQTSAMFNNHFVIELSDDMDTRAVKDYLLHYVKLHPRIKPTWMQKIMHLVGY